METTPESDPRHAADTGGRREELHNTGRERTPAITAVRYGAMSWVGEFTYKRKSLTRCGAPVVIQTERGMELGRQLELSCERLPQAVSLEQIRRYVDLSGAEFCRPRAGRVLREATAQDIDEHRRLNLHTKEDIQQCARIAAELDLDIKVVAAEHLLGGERIVFYFRAAGRIDFRDLVKQLAHNYRTRIEMRQVGARDEARLVADWEVCGRECCCKNFLKNLRPVNMKMAKLQKSTLDPSKVSGRCGRLRCCLRYEHDGYQTLSARLPRKGSRVATEFGEGTVVDHQILTQLVMVRTEGQKEVAVPLEEIKAFNLPPPKPREPEAAEASPASGPERDSAKSERTRQRHPRARAAAAATPRVRPDETPKADASPAKAPPTPPPAPRPAAEQAATPPAPAAPAERPTKPAQPPVDERAAKSAPPPAEKAPAARSGPSGKRGRRRRRRKPKRKNPPTSNAP